MLHKLGEAEEKYLHLEASLSDPAVASDPTRFVEVMKEYRNLTPIMEKYRDLLTAEQDAADAHEMLEEKDPELRALAAEEWKSARAERAVTMARPLGSADSISGLGELVQPWKNHTALGSISFILAKTRRL